MEETFLESAQNITMNDINSTFQLSNAIHEMKKIVPQALLNLGEHLGQLFLEQQPVRKKGLIQTH